MPSSGMLRRVALVRTDVSEKRSASIITVTRIGELGTTLAVTSNRSTLQRNISSPILVTVKMEALPSSKRHFLQEPHGVTSQRTEFFRVTAVKPSNLTQKPKRFCSIYTPTVSCNTFLCSHKSAVVYTVAGPY
jgi:hypothetical protein